MSSRRLASRRIPDVLDDPARNRGAAFSLRERDQLGLTGRLPPAVQTLAEQADRAYRQLRSLPDDVARGIYLSQLQDHNETLYFRVLADHLADLLPLVADPAASEPATLYPAEHRRPCGIYLSADWPGQIEPSLATLGLGPGDVDIIACSDAADLPGLGDWGLAGARTAAGKLAVYTAGGGIRPDRVIAVSLDAGTDNEALLHDPLYPGSRHARRRGAGYGAFLGRYVQTAAGLFPGALLHFQDFTPAQARATMQAYGADYRVFDGGLQGGGAMVLAAVYAASRVTGIPVKHQVMVVAGRTRPASPPPTRCARPSPPTGPAASRRGTRSGWWTGRACCSTTGPGSATSRRPTRRSGPPPAGPPAPVRPGWPRSSPTPSRPSCWAPQPPARRSPRRSSGPCAWPPAGR